MGFVTAWMSGVLEILLPWRSPKVTPPPALRSIPGGLPEHPATIRIDY
jgi:hypothetical protein